MCQSAQVYWTNIDDFGDSKTNVLNPGPSRVVKEASRCNERGLTYGVAHTENGSKQVGGCTDNWSKQVGGCTDGGFEKVGGCNRGRVEEVGGCTNDGFEEVGSCANGESEEVGVVLMVGLKR